MELPFLKLGSMWQLMVVRQHGGFDRCCRTRVDKERGVTPTFSRVVYPASVVNLFKNSYSSRVNSSGPPQREDTLVFLVQLVALDNNNTKNIQSIQSIWRLSKLNVDYLKNEQGYVPGIRVRRAYHRPASKRGP